MSHRTYQTPSTDLATTASFADVIFLAPSDANPLPNGWLHIPEDLAFSLHLKNTGGNAIDWRILGANDRATADADCEVVASGTGLAAAGTAFYRVQNPPYCFYKLQHRDTSGGSHGATWARAAAKGEF